MNNWLVKKTYSSILKRWRFFVLLFSFRESEPSTLLWAQKQPGRGQLSVQLQLYLCLNSWNRLPVRPHELSGGSDQRNVLPMYQPHRANANRIHTYCFFFLLLLLLPVWSMQYNSCVPRQQVLHPRYEKSNILCHGLQASSHCFNHVASFTPRWFHRFPPVISVQ